MRLLFFKANLGWPRTYGHDVHSFEMMRALAELGHEVALASEVEPSPQALARLRLHAFWTVDPAVTSHEVRLTYWQERYRSYWGTAPGRIRSLRKIAAEWQPDAVVVVGLETLAYLAAPDGPVRVWYAADEWVRHYLTQVVTDPRGSVEHLKAAAIKGGYERAYGSVMDAVWVVSEAERRAMRWVSGCRQVDVIPNGVDADTFRPVPGQPVRHSAVFWGRLGFGPNLQALRWFCDSVWPLVLASAPDARFSILGSDPPQEVQRWDGRTGIRVVPNLEDLRPAISEHELAVLPFVSGGGIKNKLLEAAAMERAIVTTTRALAGLRSAPPVETADTAQAFAAAMIGLWNDPARQQEMGLAARRWVISSHGWRRAAEQAVAGIERARATAARRKRV